MNPVDLYKPAFCYLIEKSDKTDIHIGLDRKGQKENNTLSELSPKTGEVPAKWGKLMVVWLQDIQANFVELRVEIVFCERRNMKHVNAISSF